MVLFPDQVEKKLNLSIKNSKNMSVEELKEEVDNAIQKVSIHYLYQYSGDSRISFWKRP